MCLVLSAGVFFAYINPLWHGDIAEAKAGIADDERALKSAAEYVKRQNELAEQKNAIDPAALARLETFLPNSVNNVGLILDLNALAEEAGLALESMDVAGDAEQPTTDISGEALEGEPVGSVDMIIAAKGTYDSLQTFLAGIESSARLLDERELTVAGSDTGVYEYQLTIRLYWLR
jgi:Tfp pilus assembly protein PilO